MRVIFHLIFFFKKTKLGENSVAGKIMESWTQKGKTSEKPIELKPQIQNFKLAKE